MNDLTINLSSADLSESAKEAIRFSFNPSGDATVNRIKFLAAALISEYEHIRDQNGGKAGREAAVAITNLQTASMWGVLAATKGFK